MSELHVEPTVVQSCSSMVLGMAIGTLTGAPCWLGPRLLRSWESLLTSSQYGLHCRRHNVPCGFLTWRSAEA